jgi:3-dehydroquinate dehydratase-1
MELVVSVTGPEALQIAHLYSPDLIELRLDLVKGDLRQEVEECRAETDRPIIGTLRSTGEGGRFSGDSGTWGEIMMPLLPLFHMVDIETAFRDHAPAVKEHGKVIIASLHRPAMPSPEELGGIEAMLRGYGYLPKIVVQPRNEEDILTLCAFTLKSPKPVITGIMGTRFGWARALLPLFGSSYMYCHAGIPTADGQYHIRDARMIFERLRPGTTKSR